MHHKMTRRQALQLLGGSVLATQLPVSQAAKNIVAKVSTRPLRIAMSLGQIPATTGQPDQGLEGYNFCGYTLYDALINWKLDDPNISATLIPGLATSWSVDSTDKTKWTFHLRKGVKFHDGSTFNADAVVWNLEKVFDSKSPQYDARQAGQVHARVLSLKTWHKVDDSTIELITFTPDATFPAQMAYMFYSSPSQWEKVGRSWNKFAFAPSGTGPFKLQKLIPNDRAVLARNSEYWDSKRIPRSEQLVIIPMADATSRTNALMSGEVDIVRDPPPDIIPRIKARGYSITSEVYPHVWPYFMSFLPGSPWNDIRVRKALNLAINRDAIVKLVHGYGVPAVGVVDVKDKWFGHPKFHIRYDPTEAKQLLAAAGYTTEKPLRFSVITAPTGSGQMLPLPMNEYIQQNFKEVGVQMKLEIAQWETVRACRRGGAGAPICGGAIGDNNSTNTQDAYSAFKRVYWSGSIAPKGFNFGHLKDPHIDALIDKGSGTFDQNEQDKIWADLHSYIVDQALDVWVLHDTGPRAMSKKVKGFVQVKNWIQDLTPVYVEA